MNSMGYNPYDSSGTDDDLPRSQNRGLRGRSFSGNGRASVGPFPYGRPHNDLESEVHLVEQEAYTGVLRAFKVQSDALSWEKESLISELRKELRVSDEEHRELLNKVNEDGAIRRMRELRQGGETQSGLHRGLQSPVMPPHSVPPSAKWGPSSASKGKKAKPMTPVGLPSMDPTSLISRKVFTRWPDDNNFYEATITRYNPATGEHALVYDMGKPTETWESVRLSDMAPEDIRWDLDDQVSGRGRVRLSQNEHKDYAAPPNGINRNIGQIDVPNTQSVVIEVERVLSNPNIREIEKAKKLLTDQEQSLLDAIASLDEASDSESEDMAMEGRMGSAGDHLGRNGIAC
ncbi:hypothetical protein BRADI_4g33810v3 [Brachypodium distachyon]|uniref:ENT domain-containing protein n=1 Tax=Brachypodium distachyon TaxID=15368 RepID=A0A0Q3ETC3_BRADI|nr:hypothetical protein BRADI_4g33810v3 [Brachypodium distachyon]